MVGSLYCYSKYLISSAIFFIYNSQINRKMEECCHIQAVNLSLLRLYSNGKCSEELHSLVSQVLMFTFKTHHTTPHVMQRTTLIPFIFPVEVHSHRFFQRTDALFNRFLRECFHDHYKLNLFKSSVNRYHPHIAA